MIENMKRNLIWFQASIKKEIDQNEFENKVVNELYAVVKEVFGKLRIKETVLKIDGVNHIGINEEEIDTEPNYEVSKNLKKWIGRHLGMKTLKKVEKRILSELQLWRVDRRIFVNEYEMCK